MAKSLQDFDEWLAFCRETAEPSRQELEIKQHLDTTWRELGVSPPPPSEDTTRRIPLVVADRLRRRAEKAKKPETKVKHLWMALKWLDHPHPRSRPATLREIEQDRAVIRRELAEAERAGPG